MRDRLAPALVLLSVTLFAAPATKSAEQLGAAAERQLPPLSYVCPMPQDADVVEDRPGNCPKCGMKLEPARLDSKYACSVHTTQVVRDKPGTCPLDGRDLLQVTLSEFWICAGDDTHLLEPGMCADGQPRKVRYELRAHGDHNPRHGGQFFMASDNWHHLEGTYPSAGVFRVHFYDNFTKPIDVAAFSGRVVRQENGRDGERVDLKRSRDGKTLDALVNQDRMPLQLAALIKFTRDGKEQRFDFTFPSLTMEPATPVPSAATTSGAPAPASPAVAPDASPVFVQSAPAPALAAALDEAALPNSTPELLAELTARSQEVGQLIDDGNLASVWLPAMAAKTVALALESYAGQLSDRQRVLASAAVKRVVVAAWEIDAQGDLGNKQKIAEAYQNLASAVSDLKTIYAASR